MAETKDLLNVSEASLNLISPSEILDSSSPPYFIYYEVEGTWEVGISSISWCEMDEEGS